MVSTVDELKQTDARGQVLLLLGELVREQLFPRGFPFYFPDEHEAVYAAVDRAKPAAVIAATGRNPEVAGGAYPFPFIEDGTFPFPSAYMTDEMGVLVAEAAASVREVHLRIDSHRVPATAEQVEARLGETSRVAQGARVARGRKGRILVTAHIDSKEGAPGAIDNAGGVTVLLLLARLLAEYTGPYEIELVPFNGEDYYAVPGQLDWFRRNEDSLDNVALVVNIDGAGYYDGETEYSFYEVDPGHAESFRSAFGAGGGDGAGGFREGQEWYQGDHAMFAQRGIPAVAVTSERIWELSESVTHTSRDVPEIVDPARLARLAAALGDALT
jgi:aminopeptidase YwaD